VALAIDATTPAVASSGTATATTASFNPPAGSLLLVVFAGNTGSGVAPGTPPSITDNLGAHLTYTPGDWAQRSDTPLVDGQAASWTAPVGAGGAMTVSVTDNAASNPAGVAIKVYVMTGADTSTVGSHGELGSASASSIARSYSATRTGSQGFLPICDWDALPAITAGSGCTSDGSVSANGITYGFIRRTSADGVQGNLSTLNATLGGTSTNLHYTWIEIMPAGGSAPAVRRERTFPWPGDGPGVMTRVALSSTVREGRAVAGPAAVDVDAQLVVTATLAADQTHEAVAAAPLAVTATLAAVQTHDAPIAAPLAVTATLAAAAGREAVAAAPLAVSATLAADATITAAGISADAALAVTATLAAAAAREAVAAGNNVSATATLAAAVTIDKPVAAGLAVTASMSAAAARSAEAAAPSTVTATLAAGTVETKPIAAPLAVTATTSAAAPVDRPAAAALAVTATTSAAAARTAAAAAPLAVTATSTAGTTVDRPAAATLAVTATTSATIVTGLAVQQLVVTATLTAAGTREQMAAATVAVTVTRTAGATVARPVAAPLAGIATLAAGMVAAYVAAAVLVVTAARTAGLDVLPAYEPARVSVEAAGGAHPLGAAGSSQPVGAAGQAQTLAGGGTGQVVAGGSTMSGNLG
jgi:hypothetical protein